MECQKTNFYEYNIKNSFSFKGKFAVFANIIGVLIIIPILISVPFLFDFAPIGTPRFLIDLMQLSAFSIAILFGAVGLSQIIHIIFLKIGDGGKLKLHFGLLIEVYSQKPIKRNIYLIGQLLALFIPLAILCILVVFLWRHFTFLALIFHIATTTLGNLPIIVFLTKQSKKDFVHFQDKQLNILSLDNK